MSSPIVAKIVLDEFYEKLVDIYAYISTTSGAYKQWNQILCGAVGGPSSPSTTLESDFYFATGEPADGTFKYTYRTSVRNIISQTSDNGPLVSQTINLVIVFVYALWEDNFRQELAKLSGRREKNDIQSDFFADLAKYRHAIAHGSNKLQKAPKSLIYFSKGETIKFTTDQFEDLFSKLLAELERMAKTYLNVDKSYKLHQTSYR